MVDARYARGGETCESIAERMDSIAESTVWTSPTLHRPSVDFDHYASANVEQCVSIEHRAEVARSAVRRFMR